MQACAALPEHAGLQLGRAGQAQWFINDGIHYTSAGYAERACYIADGLAAAFPASGPSTGCLVSLPSS